MSKSVEVTECKLGHFDLCVDYVSKSIEDKLNKLQRELPSFNSEFSIHRVTGHLREMNYTAYEPKVISIGPFHHDQQKFKDTENLKLRFFNNYQHRKNCGIDYIVGNVLKLEKEARTYYSETIDMSSEKFVEMMVLDGCFVVEFLIKDWRHLFHKNANKVHNSFYKVIDFDIQLDLIKLENQLPISVLQDLFAIVSPLTPAESIGEFEKIVLSFLMTSGMLPSSSRPLASSRSNKIMPCHLLDFLSCCFINPLNDETNVVLPLDEGHYLPPSATQLHEAGVVFKKVQGDEKYLVNISFKHGILKITPLKIDAYFETWARNLLAFAQLNSHEDVTGYFEFLNELIITEKDLNLLVREGIILHRAGFSDVEVLILLNDVLRNITLPSRSRFSSISKRLQQHCGRKRNKFMASVRRNWMASFKDKYFRTPWAFISVLAATFLLILTLLQTIYTVKPSFK